VGGLPCGELPGETAEIAPPLAEGLAGVRRGDAEGRECPGPKWARWPLRRNPESKGLASVAAYPGIPGGASIVVGAEGWSVDRHPPVHMTDWDLCVWCQPMCLAPAYTPPLATAPATTTAATFAVIAAAPAPPDAGALTADAEPRERSEESQEGSESAGNPRSAARRARRLRASRAHSGHPRRCPRKPSRSL
jgi:hypothetical protein